MRKRLQRFAENIANNLEATLTTYLLAGFRYHNLIHTTNVLRLRTLINSFFVHKLPFVAFSTLQYALLDYSFSQSSEKN